MTNTTHKNTRSFLPIAGAAATVAVLMLLSVQVVAKDRSLVERGRYIVVTSGCNDCHTPMYIPKNGEVPESEWLIGDTVGWSGPWGTTYPTNLRAKIANMSEKDWIQFARHFKARPPMPYFNVNAMSERDLQAIYHYAKHLGASDHRIPDALPPGVAPKTPYINMNVNMPKSH